MRFVLTLQAAEDLSDIWDYIAAANVDAADRVLASLERAMRKLARSPGIGHLREELADRHHRFFLVFSYLVVYRPSTKPLEVIRVLSASRDVQSILGFSPEED
jgi:toxin ParE1/3/4